VFGESWDLSAYRPSGKLSWTSRIPGAITSVCQAGDCLAVAITDLSAAGTPSLALLDAASGRILWVNALRAGVWRTVGVLENGTVVAALTSCVVAFERNGSLAWTFEPTQAILAAAIIGETTCLSLRVNRRLLTLVYPYEVTALSQVGVVSWSRPVRQEPMRLQQWMGKEAVVAIAENHVLGFKIRDGARLFAERTGASPVDLTGDKLLIRDNRGIRLVRLRSVRPPST
jgi:outer membrane protein assembly factor BamB